MERGKFEKAKEIIEKINYHKHTKDVYECEIPTLLDSRGCYNNGDKTELRERLLKILFADVDNDIEELEEELNAL